MFVFGVRVCVYPLHLVLGSRTLKTDVIEFDNVHHREIIRSPK